MQPQNIKTSNRSPPPPQPQLQPQPHTPTTTSTTATTTPTTTMSWVQMSATSALTGPRQAPKSSSSAQNGKQRPQRTCPFQASDSTASSSSASSSLYGSSCSPVTYTQSSAHSSLAAQPAQQQQKLFTCEDPSASPMISAPSSLLSSSSSGPNSSMASMTERPGELSTGQEQQRQQIDEELMKQQQEEENRKLRLQLYVFVLRCISYSFNAKQSSLSEHLHHRQQLPKLRRAQLDQIVQLHTKFLQNPSSFVSSNCPHQSLVGVSKVLDGQQQRYLDELYERSHRVFNFKFLQNERLRLLVEAECCSQQDLRELFRQNADHILKESSLFASHQNHHHHHHHHQQPQQQQSNPVIRSSFRESPAAGRKSSAYHQQQEAMVAAGSQQQSNGFAPAGMTVNKETILNSWMIKFESIIRDETSAEQSDLPVCSSGSSSSPTPQLITSSPAVSQVTSTVLASNQQQPVPAKISKEQLYQMFQNILSIKKFEHQLLYNALQLDSADEQAAAIRRELDGRIARIVELERNKKLMPKFVLKEMESLYLEEARMSVNKLMVNLDSLPVTKGGGSHANLAGSTSLSSQNNLTGHHHPITGSGIIGPGLAGSTQSGGSSNESSSRAGVSYGLQKFRRYNSRAQASLTRDGLAETHPSEPSLSKLDVLLTFNIEVIVMEVRGLKNISPNREIYCTMEIEGSERLQTEHVQAKKPLWDTQGDFTTNHPLPVLKIKLYAVNQSMLSLEDKELGKLILRPTVLGAKSPEWCTMQPTNSSQSASNSDHHQQHHNSNELKIRIVVRMDRPPQLKHCGYLYGIGKSTWRKLKRRYHILIQVSQYTFVMCSYRDKKAKPTEMLQLDGYTVDYIEPPTDIIMEHCQEISANEQHCSSSSSHHHHYHGSSTLALAGRLANVILKQPSSSSSSSGALAGGSLLADGQVQPDSQSSSSSLMTGGPDVGASPLTALGGSSSAADGQPPSAIQTAAALSDELHSKYYFNVVREGDSVVFACDDEQECFGWVMALYRATGQAHKPIPLRNQYSSLAGSSSYIDTAFAYQTSATQQTKLVGNSGAQVTNHLSLLSTANGQKLGPGVGVGGLGLGLGLGGVGLLRSSVDVADQRARKHGMDEFISADPCKFQHNHLFKYLQNETLRYRLNDAFCSMGWFSSGQVLVLDEYCARYGVRTCFRHLAYLNSLLDFNETGYFIDHTLLNYGYDFCSSHVSGNSGQAHPMGSVNFDLRPDGIGTVTVEERDMFNGIKQKLLKMIERQISNFFYCFPFGKPDGALKSALSLMERVLMKEQQTNSMVQNEEVRNLIRKCLEQAALNNYTKLSGQANLLQPLPGADRLSQRLQSTTLVLDGDQIAPTQVEAQPSSNLLLLGGEQVTSGGIIADTLQKSIGRLRTSSNLSSSSLVSQVSSTVSSTGANQQQQQQSLPSSHNELYPFKVAGQQQPQPQQCLTMAVIISSDLIKPRDKLLYLARLAELCCDQVEESNQYYSDAFAWHSDLMTDHFELFWSLFSVDMDKILSELSTPNQQLSQTGNGDFTNNNWEVFTLFQILNDHMRNRSNLECKKFKSYLCDTFKPKLLRYIDIMESTLTRMLFKAYEKDNQVNCLLIEQMFIKLDELQKFVLNQLCWPDIQLAEQLQQRLKLIAYELCDASVQRTLQVFQGIEKKSNKWTAATSSSSIYVVPTEMVQMINLALETRNKSQKLCTFTNNLDQMSYHYKIESLVESALDEMQPGLMTKMLNALESTLTKLARFDEGNLLAPILSITYKQGMSSSGRDIGKQYVTYVSNCCDLIRHKINDELWVVTLLEDWYAAQMNTICTWLGERIDRSLHEAQLIALSNIMPKIYADMSLQGLSEDKLSLKSYQTIMSRLKMEEASALASGGSLEQTGSSSIFNTSILSSLTSSSNSTAGSIPNQSSSAIGASANVPSSSSAISGSQMAATGPIRKPSYHSQHSIGSRQSGSPQKLQQQQQSPLDSPGLQARRFQNLNLTNSNQPQSDTGQPTDSANDGQQQATGENIADRALQSAARMFKGFWN